MKTATFGAFVIAAASLFATGTALAQSGSGGGSAGSGSAGSGTSGMTSQGLGSEPAGIGERGTGQTQSTLERAGAAGQKGMTSEPAGIGEKGTGQTQSTMERSGLGQSGTAQSGSPLPSGVGEQGTGQTQSTTERSGGQGEYPKPVAKRDGPSRKVTIDQVGAGLIPAPRSPAIHFSTNFFNPSSIIFQFFSECIRAASVAL